MLGHQKIVLEEDEALQEEDEFPPPPPGMEQADIRIPVTLVERVARRWLLQATQR